VCGWDLGPPIAECPRCATPHHADCWEYNRGCSIYGCTGGRVVAPSGAVSLPDLRVAPPPAPMDTTRAALATLVVAGIGTTVGVAPALVTAGALGAWALIRRPETVLEPVRARVDLSRERKSVSAVLGTDQLAQAYGLFEQRHPTEALDRDDQAQVARELLSAGHRAMGLAALEKALTQRGLDDKSLLDERRRLLVEDPAYLVDGLAGPLGPAVAMTGLEDAVTTLRTALRVDPPEGTWWLLALTPRGWPMEFQTRPALPSFAAPGARARASLLAGPFDQAEAAVEARARWHAGQPALIVPDASLTLPQHVEPVHQVHVSQKGAVFATAAGERAFGWEDVRTAVYARIDVVTKVREIVREDSFDVRGIRSTEIGGQLRERVVSHPALEIHAGEGHDRFRIEAPHPGLFDYLGRRRESSHAANLALVARDLARFGGGMRASHGLMYLLGNRTGPAHRFPDRAHFEEYVLWFHAMGTPAVRALWEPLLAQLTGQEAA
jgi:hypothetical protein